MKSLFFQKTRILSKSLETATAEEVDAVETDMGVNFPPGYKEYVTTFGIGEYSGEIRIYMPSHLLNINREFQRRLQHYFFWDEGRDVLPKEKVLESVVIGDTLNGDTIIFHPSCPDVLYMLPHEDERIPIIGSDLYEALEWVCRRGRIRRRDFKSSVDLLAECEESHMPSDHGGEEREGRATSEIVLEAMTVSKPIKKKKAAPA